MKKAHPIIHDGCHISNYRNSFEWWYFDFDLESQHHIYIEWQAPIFNLRDNYCMLIIRIHNPERGFNNNHNKKSEAPLTKVFRYRRSLVAQNPTLCQIVFPTGHIVERAGNYFIKVNERNLLIDIELERVLPSVIAEDEVLLCARSDKEFFSWNIPLPRALATGQIKVDGEHIEVNGTAYHDHNWGNLNIRKYLIGWIWARFFFDDFTFIFGNIAIKESKENIQVLLLIDKDGKKVDFSSSKVEYMNTSNHNYCTLSLPRTVSLIFNGRENYRFHLIIKKNLAVQEFPLGSFQNHLWNSALTRAYYFFTVNKAPNFIKKWFGRSLYFQFSAQSELYVDGNLADTKNGNVEVFSFAD